MITNYNFLSFIFMMYKSIVLIINLKKNVL